MEGQKNTDSRKMAEPIPVPIARSIPQSPSMGFRDMITRGLSRSSSMSPDSPQGISLTPRAWPITGSLSMGSLVLTPSIASADPNGTNGCPGDESGASLSRGNSVQRAAQATMDFKDMWLSP
uniref:Uncharacterized protein n=1 Tax=Timspurckia oligopyrenoides TaxID=708627 RepID=A0A7S1EUG5_9RHOD|mmetsp:Transcript_9655/g.17402  ORF Transcript_9655/g.17402 Transcript_9655/m.17402 type:complete len:122 (+) Transcript_9655:277-642(+)|eukprot:CAMPEP_0182446066 /NCGR_PEP_ID=MMETSP1172-20130603/3961_1 /TAXON_ID=708627 /ORGANISM="Timspurckia oligopyrenoides, Strain CCMP3278" /LENGTH=121 /DNA_ID=CAMNT_0024641935 /DNA_START=146 /DNA_END=511 /DNA_ORIENTATION=-